MRANGKAQRKVNVKLPELVIDRRDWVFKVKDVDEPYEITALRINRSDRHILTRGELENLRTCGKSEFYQFAEERGYNSKEFKEAFKPFRKVAKKED